MLEEHLSERTIEGYKHLTYPCTNECIEAVITGLDLRPSDTVVSIAGSGDIPIAVAPFVEKVYAIDSSPSQIKFLKNQLRMLNCGNLEGFFHDELTEESCPGEYDVHFEDLARRREYFLKNAVKVQGSLGKIEVVGSEMIKFLTSMKAGSVDALYLSNMYVTRETVPKHLEYGSRFCEGLKCISKGGRVYHSDAFYLKSPEGFRTLETNSSSAKDLERKRNPSWDWSPRIFEKL